MLRVLIADDESMARRRLHRLLGTLPGVEVVGECSDGLEVLEAVRDQDVDVVLLDVNMPNLDGLAALRALQGSSTSVVLVTAHPDHALAAFDGGAVDYVLKPVDPDRLRRALDRIRERTNPATTPEALGRLALPTLRGVVLVPFAAISAAVIDGESVVLHTDEGPLFTDLRLSALAERLPETFLRVHRKALIHLERLVRLEPNDSGGYVAHLDDGTRVGVSRACARDLRRRWRIPTS